MAIILDICESLAKFILKKPFWKNTPIHYHEGEVTPGSKFPCIVIEPKGIDSVDNTCVVNPKRNIEISLYLEKGNVRDSEKKIWKFEEDVLRSFADKFTVPDLHPNIDTFKYIRTKPIKTMEVKKSSDSEWESVADFMTVIFELNYNLEE